MIHFLDVWVRSKKTLIIKDISRDSID